MKKMLHFLKIKYMKSSFKLLIKLINKDFKMIIMNIW